MNPDAWPIYRHWRCRPCRGEPLTLADKELITGRSVRQFDERTGRSYCTDCLTDLPVDDWVAVRHICGEAPGAVEVEHVVCYHGTLDDYWGSIWEVTGIDRNRLTLFDVDRAMRNVWPGEVTIVGRKQIPWGTVTYRPPRGRYV